MNYIKCTFSIEPFNSDFADVLAAYLGDCGFESFETTEMALLGYVPENFFEKDAIDSCIESVSDMFLVKWTSENIPQVNWNEEWEKNYFQPLLISDKVLIKSTFHKTELAGEIEIVIDPKMAFGTGHHHTTSLVVQTMLEMNLEGKKVMDMGCGTGILAILAVKRGAKDVTAIDIDDWSYRNTLENLQLNHTPDIKVMCGDAGIIPDEVFDVFIANINRNILLNDMQIYANTVPKDGVLLMSGFYETDIQVIEAEANRCGFVLVDFKKSADWVCTKFVKK